MGCALIFWLCFSIHAMLCPSIFTSLTNVIGRNETDRLSLLEFKAKITDDPFGVMSSWNDSIDFCNWYGVTCNRRHQRVTILDLGSLKLAGSLSPHVGNLSFLGTLRLQNNSFSGAIPPEIGHLRRLRTMTLCNNSFTGEIPAYISGCSNLIAINFEQNKLVGKITGELGILSQLRYFIAFGNNLTGGIPPFFGNFSFLQVLDVSQNRLDGSIPAALGRLTNLEFIGLGENNLLGTVPSSLYNISSITLIHLLGNKLEGTFPPDFGLNLPNLQVLNLAINRFTGFIPVSISNATNLSRIDFGINNLIGKVPTLERLHKLQLLSIDVNNLGIGEDDLSFLSSLANATSLQKLYLSENNFQGLLPESIGNLSTLEIIDFGSNQLFGTIPTGILNIKNLQLLHLHENNFTGLIPAEIGKLNKLNDLRISSNKFSGNIPSSIGNLSSLITLRLDANNFQGHIPSSIGNCLNLLSLNLSHNNLTGTVPKEVIGLSSLSLYLDLSNNHLTGSLPIEVGKLINLGQLSVSHNMLSGEIPSSLGSCVRLEVLSMQGNFMQGNIPSTLSSLRGIEVLDLSDNNLNGQIPAFLKDFKSLEYLNLSFNEFEGLVPVEGIFKNASATSVMGNNKLCGGIPEFQLPICIIKKSDKRRLTLTVKLILIISGFLVITSVLYFLYHLFVKKKRHMHASSFSSNFQMSYQSLLKATDAFSSRNLIGMGSFGSVYKGILDEDGTVIAVKVLNLLQPGASKSFMAECEALRNIRHRNLVKILTACSGIDYHGNDFKALIYKFMANGSLEEWLHPCQTVDEAPKALNFLQRLNVAIDVACALDYLHHQCDTPIVHCDLKPSNVLLDHDMIGHHSNFVNTNKFDYAIVVVGEPSYAETAGDSMKLTIFLFSWKAFVRTSGLTGGFDPKIAFATVTTPGF